METLKKISKLSIAVSIILISMSILLYSFKNNSSKADSNMSSDGYTIVGLIYQNSSAGPYDIKVIGYNETTKDIKVLASKDEL
jgi:hypothetical protein